MWIQGTNHNSVMHFSYKIRKNQHPAPLADLDYEKSNFRPHILLTQ